MPRPGSPCTQGKWTFLCICYLMCTTTFMSLLLLYIFDELSLNSSSFVLHLCSTATCYISYLYPHSFGIFGGVLSYILRKKIHFSVSPLHICSFMTLIPLTALKDKFMSKTSQKCVLKKYLANWLSKLPFLCEFWYFTIQFSPLLSKHAHNISCKSALWEGIWVMSNFPTGY